MKIYLGADHGGFHLKEEIKNWLVGQSFDVVDKGNLEYQETDDYPDYAFQVADAVAIEPDSVGFLFCRSGGGMAIAANKVKGVRAVDVFDLTSVVHAKTDNNANIISVGADWMEPAEVKLIIENFLNTQFNSEERHLRRLQKITEREKLTT